MYDAPLYNNLPLPPPMPIRMRWRCPEVLPALTGSLADLREFKALLRTLCRSDSIFVQISQLGASIATALYDLVLIQRREPSQPEIAAYVTLRYRPCSLSSVEVWLRRLRRLGVITWAARWKLVLRRDPNNVRTVQARQIENMYRFHLPPEVQPSLPQRIVQKLDRARAQSADRKQPWVAHSGGTLPVCNDRRNSGVSYPVESNSELLDSTASEIDGTPASERQARLQREWRQNAPLRQAKLVEDAKRAVMGQRGRYVLPRVRPTRGINAYEPLVDGT